jgi:serine/threonine protein kinase
MGEVWRATRWGDAQVAVKLMSTALADTPAMRTRFEREARAAAKLQSQHVVKVFDHGVDEATGSPFIVMELLAGESLGDRLRSLTVLPSEEVLKLVKHVGRALSCARAARVVHRDLKPDNVFLVDNGDEPIFKVLDFGLAKTFDLRSQSSSPWRANSRAVTVPGDAVGTPAYMSPEQFLGVEADHVSDLWSLAVIACECLVGSKAFLPLWTLQLFAGERPIPSQLGVKLPGFDAWFAKATHRHMDERFQTAEELVEALCGSSRRHMPPVQIEKVGPPRAGTLPPVTHAPPAGNHFFPRHQLALGLALGLGLGGLGIAYGFRHELTSERATTVAASQALPLTPAPDSSAASDQPPRQGGGGAAAEAQAPLSEAVHDHPAPAVSSAKPPATPPIAAAPSGLSTPRIAPVATPEAQAADSKPTHSQPRAPNKRQRRPRAPTKNTPPAPVDAAPIKDDALPEFAEELL